MARSQSAFLALRHYHYCEDNYYKFSRTVQKRAIKVFA
jgi:hypothetical protein